MGKWVRQGKASQFVIGGKDDVGSGGSGGGGGGGGNGSDDIPPR